MGQGLAMTYWILFHLDPLHVLSPLTSEYPVILFLGGNEKHDIVMDVSRQNQEFLSRTVWRWIAIKEFGYRRSFTNYAY